MPKVTAFVTLLICVFPSASFAALMTDVTKFKHVPSVIDFNNLVATFDFQDVPLPFQVGGSANEDITWQTTDVNGTLIGEGTFGLGTNGRWDGAIGDGSAFVALGGRQEGTMSFTFNDGPVSAVGGLLNYVPNAVPPRDYFFEALDINGVVLESYNMLTAAPIKTLADSINAGEFRGIQRGLNDISVLQFRGGGFVFDNLTFERVGNIPEPGSLLLAAMAGWGLLAWPRQARHLEVIARPADGPDFHSV